MILDAHRLARGQAICLVASLALVPKAALAGGEAEGRSETSTASPVHTEPVAAPAGFLPYFRLLGTLQGGTGLRFNNPYRLATPLGDSAESVSRTSAYVDAGLAVLFGAPTLVQHGPALRLSVGLEGVPEQVLAPSYLVCREVGSFQPCARVGVPIVLAQDSNAGVEVGLGVSYYLRAGLGVLAEANASLFYGAATREVAYPAYPIVSGQLGVVVSYEVLR